MSDLRVRRQLALAAVQLFLLTTTSLLPAAVAQAQDATAPPALLLEMAADPTSYSAVDEFIDYEYLLTNTGGVAFDAVTVGDTRNGTVTCPSGPLAPGGYLVCYYGYLITQDDLDAGSLTNIAQAIGTYGDGEEVDSNEASLTLTAVATAPPALLLEMAADPTSYSAVDEFIDYEYLLTNTGGVAFDAVTVGDTRNGTVTCPSGRLAPGGYLVCYYGYLITQDDLDAGSLTNIAQAIGTYGDGEEVDSNEASLTLTAATP